MTSLAVQSILLGLTSAVAAVWDARTRRIPNWLTFSSLAAGLLFQGWLGEEGVRAGLWGAGLAAAVYIPLFALRAMGAGDVKLMIALGAIAGPERWIAIFLASSIFGGVGALGMAAARRRWAETWFNTGLLVQLLARGEAPYKSHAALDVRNPQSFRLPHGVPIAAGTYCVIAMAAIGIL